MRYVEMVDDSGHKFTASEGGTVTLRIPVDISASPGSQNPVTGHMDVSYVYTVTRIYETPRRWGIRRGVR